MTFYERSNDAIIASEAWQSNEIDKQSLRDCHITWFLAMTNDYIFRGGDAAPTKSSTTRYVVEFSCGARICGQKKRDGGINPQSQGSCSKCGITVR